MTDSDTDDEFIKQLAKDFVRDMLTQLKSLDSKIKNREVAELAVFGHTLKGSGTIFGYPEISELGMHLEDAVRAGDWDGVENNTKKLIEFIENILQ